MYGSRSDLYNSSSQQYHCLSRNSPQIIPRQLQLTLITFFNRRKQTANLLFVNALSLGYRNEIKLHCHCGYILQADGDDDGPAWVCGKLQVNNLLCQ